MEAFTAFQVIGGVAGALGQRAEAMGESARMESEARLADTQALQRDTMARDELSRYLSTMKAARAANGLSMTSPNAIILAGAAQDASDQDRLRQRADDRQRAANFRASAKSYRSAGKWSLITGLGKAAVPLAEYGSSKGWFDGAGA